MTARTYTMTGATYQNRAMLRRLGARYNPDARSWTLQGMLADATVWQLRRQGVRVAID